MTEEEKRKFTEHANSPEVLSALLNLASERHDVIKMLTTQRDEQLEQQKQLRQAIAKNAEHLKEVKEELLGTYGKVGLVTKVTNNTEDIHELKEDAKKHGNQHLIASTTSGGSVVILWEAIKHVFGGGNG